MEEIFDTKASARNSPTSAGGTDSAGKGKKAFDQDTADKTGMGKSTVQQSRTRADDISTAAQDRLTDPEAPDAIKAVADSGVSP